MQDSGSSGPLCDHGVSPEQRGRGCRTQQSDSSGDVREMLLLRISLAIKLRVQVNAGNLCGNKPPYPLPGKVAFRAGISAAGGGGGGCPSPFLSKEKRIVGKRRVSGLSLGVCSVSEMQWLELYFSLESYLPQDA